jgi:hypothetical protein
MSTKNSDFNALHTAGLTGMGNFHGDAEVAEDLGIATTPESLYSDIEAGQKVGALLASHDELPTSDVIGRQGWVESFHLSHPSHEFSGIPRKTTEEQAATTANIDAVRAQVRPLGDRPTNPAA